MHSRIGQPANNISVYLLAGVATAPNFMEEFREVLGERLTEAQWEVRHTELLFPYGDWSRSLVQQLREIGRDVYPLISWRKSLLTAIGGRNALAAIQATYPMDAEGGTLLLIGHSGGGNAAVHAGHALVHEGLVTPERLRIVQIGSPKCRVPEALRASTLYLAAHGDPVTLLGGWGGWERRSNGLLRWNPRKYAPGVIARIPIVGKHPDYFRRWSPYLDAQGVPNLERTMEKLWGWLHSGEPDEKGLTD
ncbi:hypothetical protein [Paenibacillus cremeus]|uniref:Fungal lipase-like domain-containing protein n=1 Tax=Paenibacillus cremeus TaxID=2163881 RepID=A0A559JPY6_9BACL|nr:hypothetical protein [Paenibacillus cremeus]TVY01918.1 hypothetical protein FPZ49_31945 [Paenibacillus cremeus]